MSQPPPRPIGKPTLIAGAVFLTLPALIPFYFASKEQDPATFWLLIATGVTLLIANAMALILIYRWILRPPHD